VRANVRVRKRGFNPDHPIPHTHDYRSRGSITTNKQPNQLLHTKSDKLEQLVKLKDAKIAALMGRLSAAGLMA
jgi:hypothetical protein